MITDKQRERIRAMWQVQDEFRHLYTFWQDRFYSSGNHFGYPVCVQIQNNKTGQVEENIIVGWHTSQAACEAKLESVDAYIAELDAKGVKP